VSALLRTICAIMSSRGLATPHPPVFPSQPRPTPNGLLLPRVPKLIFLEYPLSSFFSLIVGSFFPQTCKWISPPFDARLLNSGQLVAFFISIYCPYAPPPPLSFLFHDRIDGSFSEIDEIPRLRHPLPPVALPLPCWESVDEASLPSAFGNYFFLC